MKRYTSAAPRCSFSTCDGALPRGLSSSVRTGTAHPCADVPLFAVPGCGGERVPPSRLKLWIVSRVWKPFLGPYVVAASYHRGRSAYAEWAHDGGYF